MFEITGNNIAELDDADLRNLIGLLCEAELRSQGLPTAGVTWGGNQDAKDGGLDVRVDLNTELKLIPDAFIPKRITGFQVKKPDMTPKKIKQEIRPKGFVRDAICALANVCGAYIIACSQASVSASSLKLRRRAMQEALSDCPNASKLAIDFYDRNRIASWVRSYPSLILWVRGKIGQPIHGWKPYENWSNPNGGIEEEYLLDGQLRLFNSSQIRSDGRPIAEGINALRAAVGQAKSSTRLVGLSGVGKTRLIQALFDDRIGQNALNPSQVFYTDMGFSPDPDPRNMAEILIALHQPVTLIIDNCPPDLHRCLTTICQTQGGQLHLITVEYDVKDDEPEETEVFRLEPASDKLIAKLLQIRFKNITDFDARRIADFAGGNARIAFALANRIKRGDSIANFTDDELFTRLFQQRNASDYSLLHTAEVCSLVYSFDYQFANHSYSELECLSSLINIRAEELYKNVRELKRRDLVQQRGCWRAVLPQAIANRLAKRALENTPIENILNTFETKNTERLLKSFSRRLGYLHDSEEAKEICERWLSGTGLLNDVSNLNDLGISMFQNVAPISPELALSAIERVTSQQCAPIFFSRQNPRYNDFTRLLRLLAYESELFTRAVSLICRFALTEQPDEKYDSIRALLKSLFHIYLSGTQATPEQRLEIIKQLVNTGDPKKTELAMLLLEAALQSFHFSSVYGFEFGARVRDYGYSPNTVEEIKHWYTLFFEYAEEIALSSSPLAPKARIVLADNFRGLWLHSWAFDELENMARKLSAQESWPEGWLAIHTTIRLDHEDMETALLSHLKRLAADLMPTSLLDLIKLYALSDGRGSRDLIDIFLDDENDFASASVALANHVKSLGAQLAIADTVLNEILPKLLSAKNSNRLFDLGQGLAEASANPMEMWRNLYSGLAQLEETERCYNILRGFLYALSQCNKNICEEILNITVNDEILSSVFPLLQTSVPVDEHGVRRLHAALALGKAPIWLYTYLAWGRTHETINDRDLCDLLRSIAAKPSGDDVAIEILMMRLYGKNKNSISSAIISLGQELALHYNYCKKQGNTSDHTDWHLSTIIRSCFKGKSSTLKAKTICQKIIQAFEKNKIYSFHDYHSVLDALAEIQPMAVLDMIVSIIPKYRWLSNEDIYSPISKIDPDAIIHWCKRKPNNRFSTISSIIQPFQSNKATHDLQWSPIAVRLIAEAPDPISVLNNFKPEFRPVGGWRGTQSGEMQRRANLLAELKKNSNSTIADWAVQEENILVKEIQEMRRIEAMQINDQDERFE